MSIFKRKTDAQPLGRNSFDLSQKRLFTASAGELLPCYCAEVLPGDKFRINVSDFLRTQACNTAAYSRMKQYVHFFFVPTRLLSTKFSQYILRSPRMDSTALTPFGSDSTFASYRQEMSVPYYPLLLKLCKIKDKIIDYKQTNLDFYSFINNNDIQKQLNGALTLKLLDLLEYGIGSINYNHLNSVTDDEYNFQNQDDILTSSSKGQTRVNLFRLLAYNRIYQDFYRDSRFESFNSITSNIDWRDCSATSEKYDYDADQGLYAHFENGDFRIRYRNYPKDYFTSNDINPYKQDSLFPSVPFNENGTFIQAFRTLSSAQGQSIRPGDTINGVVYQETPIVRSMRDNIVSTYDIRALYSLERWASRSAHARSQSYADLVKAHFGLHVNDSLNGVQFLGGSSAAVVINENVSTASTETASLGALSGVGKSTLNNDVIEFDNKNNEHGIIMGIFSIAPEPDYNSFGVDRQNLKTMPEEFFTPEFDGLGYQSTNSMEFSSAAITTLSSDLENENADNFNKVFGFLPIYSEYRTKLDKVFSEFRSELPLSYWVNPRRIALLNKIINSEDIKVRPYDVDSIFQVNWLIKSVVNSGETSSESNPGEHVGINLNDQFFVNLQVNCSAIRHMSQDGVTI